MKLHRRWMLALALFTLAVTALFGLFAMAFVYTVEDRFMNRLLQQEAQAQHRHRAAHGRWGPTGADFVVLHENRASLPAEVAQVLASEPRRLEIAGRDGRHYHLLALQAPGQPPWLVAEVSQQLVVRPIRGELLGWLAGWGGLMVGLALALGWGLARRVTAPLEALAHRVSTAGPAQSPQAAVAGSGADEVAAVALAFDAMLARTHDFIAREQAFTRDASHELRTPLAVLQLGLERLQADARLPEDARTTLATLHAAALWMQQTVESLLALAREPLRRDLPHAPVALLPLVEQWVLAHAAWLDRQALTLDLRLERQARLALPAPVLRLALANLLGNAFAHGRPGGAVTVHFDGQALCITNPCRGPGRGGAAAEGAADLAADLAAEGAADGEAGRAHGGHGFGLGIVQRLLGAAGGRLVFEQREGQTSARVMA